MCSQLWPHHTHHTSHYAAPPDSILQILNQTYQPPRLISLHYALPDFRWCGRCHSELLASHFGYRFIDADTWLLDDMVASLARHEGFTDAQRDRYYDAVVRRIGEEMLREQQRQVQQKVAPRPLAVAQATFKRRHRALVSARYPKAALWCVVTDEERRLDRLRQGGNRVDASLGKKMAANFEAPLEAEGASTLSNIGGDAELVQQIQSLLRLGL
eukprot:SAG11_NODE_1467_length_4850_cov_7.452957_6_plen_214_part_00